MDRRFGAALGTFVFLWIAPGGIAGLIPYTLTRWRMQSPSLGLSASRILGIALVVLGSAVVLECFGRFALGGRGTPAPIALTETLVVSGLYGHVRNPMYVGVMAVAVGQALLLESWTLLVYAGLVWLAFHAFIVFYEEPTLRRQFGPSYDAYRAGVRRWCPRLTRWYDSRAS